MVTSTHHCGHGLIRWAGHKNVMQPTCIQKPHTHTHTHTETCNIRTGAKCIITKCSIVLWQHNYQDKFPLTLFFGEESAFFISSATSPSSASSNRLISPCHDLGYLLALDRLLAFSNHRLNTAVMRESFLWWFSSTDSISPSSKPSRVAICLHL